MRAFLFVAQFGVIRTDQLEAPMLKDQIQAEADKAAHAIRDALAEFHRATGFEMTAKADWQLVLGRDQWGMATSNRRIVVWVEPTGVVASA